jgi:fibronectin type III domain protein
LSGRELGYWDEQRKAFVAEAGAIEIRVGSSSADIKLRKTISIQP